MPLKSMTAFATRSGEAKHYSWTWDVRGVNGKGLDVRLRVPDWITGLEPFARGKITKAMARGNIQLSLRVTRTDVSETLDIDHAAVTRILGALSSIETQAQDNGVALGPTRAVDVLTMKGVMEATTDDVIEQELADKVKFDLDGLVSDFLDMRGAEGNALEDVVNGQLDQIASLVDQAAALLPDREAAMKETVAQGVRRLVGEGVEIDPARLSQDLAQLAIKSDVTEEIDRLRAHVKAARDLVAKPEPVGRKLDFLAQEFNREANTLCSKSGSTALTAIGLDLKVTIDQMREQIQNVE